MRTELKPRFIEFRRANRQYARRLAANSPAPEWIPPPKKIESVAAPADTITLSEQVREVGSLWGHAGIAPPQALAVADVRKTPHSSRVQKLARSGMVHVVVSGSDKVGALARPAIASSSPLRGFFAGTAVSIAGMQLSISGYKHSLNVLRRAHLAAMDHIAHVDMHIGSKPQNSLNFISESPI